MRRLWIVGATLLTGVALAATSYRLIVNGQVSAASAIVVNGQTYVPLSALKPLGVVVSQQGNTLTLGAASSPAGGANGRASLEGCVGDTLFNGVWRMTVQKITPINRYNGQQKGYAVQVEWKNGTAQTIDALNSGVKSLVISLQDGSNLTAENVQDLHYKKLVQGSGQTFTLNYYAETAASPNLAQPAKFLVEIDPKANAARAPYSTPTPSFRVRLDC